MKIKLFLILLLFNFVSFAQTSEMLVDTTKLWSTLERATWGPPPQMQTTMFQKMNGDTVINLIHFKKVWESSDSLHLNWNLVGFIREDLSKKVYYQAIQSNVEKLLYDFNAQVGDTVHVYPWGMGSYTSDLVVFDIDSIVVYNKTLKRLTFQGYPPAEQWIEGIGSLEGLLACGSSLSVGAFYDLLCYYQNDTLKFVNPNFSSCYIRVTRIDETNKSKTTVDVFPNPIYATSVLSINNNKDRSSIIEIYSIYGNQLKTIITNGNNDFLLNKQDFSSGIYVYKLIFSDKTFVTGKFVVE